MPKPFAAESISPISQMRFVFAQTANHRPAGIIMRLVEVALS